jgi:hypothetical protein
MVDVGRVRLGGGEQLPQGSGRQRVILIDKHHVITRRRRHAGGARRQRALIDGMAQRGDARVFFDKAFNRRVGVIGAGIVNDDDFEVSHLLRGDAADAFGQIARVVVGGNDNRKNRHVPIISHRRYYG